MGNVALLAQGLQSDRTDARGLVQQRPSPVAEETGEGFIVPGLGQGGKQGVGRVGHGRKIMALVGRCQASDIAPTTLGRHA